MIKIERIKNVTRASIIRNKVRQPVYLGMYISPEELKTLEVVGGSLSYTVDETDIVEVQGGEVPVPVKSQEPTVPAEQSAATVETPVKTETKVDVVKPAVAKPAAKTVKK